MLTIILKNSQTSSGLDDLHVNNWKKKVEELEQIPYIWYPVTFKGQLEIETLLDSRSKINLISQVLAL